MHRLLLRPVIPPSRILAEAALTPLAAHPGAMEVEPACRQVASQTPKRRDHRPAVLGGDLLIARQPDAKEIPSKNTAPPCLYDAYGKGYEPLTPLIKYRTITRLPGLIMSPIRLFFRHVGIYRRAKTLLKVTKVGPRPAYSWTSTASCARMKRSANGAGCLDQHRFDRAVLRIADRHR